MFWNILECSGMFWDILVQSSVDRELSLLRIRHHRIPAFSMLQVLTFLRAGAEWTEGDTA